MLLHHSRKIMIVCAAASFLIVGLLVSNNQVSAPLPAGSEGEKIFVVLSTPFGEEAITSFNTMQTSNLMAKAGYYTIKLEGPVEPGMSHLMQWIKHDMNKLPSGLYVDFVKPGGDEAKITNPKHYDTNQTAPIIGKVKLKIFDSSVDVQRESVPQNPLREFKFSDCRVAGYWIGTVGDKDVRSLFAGSRLYESVTFACKEVSNFDSESLHNQGITLGQQGVPHGAKTTPAELPKPAELKQMVVLVKTDKSLYKAGEKATITVIFGDKDGIVFKPEYVKAFFDKNPIELQQKEDGIYVTTTPLLENPNHQFLIIAKNTGYEERSAFISITVVK